MIGRLAFKWYIWQSFLLKQRHDSEIELCDQNMDTILLGSLCGVRLQLRGLAAITAVAVVAGGCRRNHVVDLCQVALVCGCLEVCII